jgi:hypothetical protein
MWALKDAARRGVDGRVAEMNAADAAAAAVRQVEMARRMHPGSSPTFADVMAGVQGGVTVDEVFRAQVFADVRERVQAEKELAARRAQHEDHLEQLRQSGQWRPRTTAEILGIDGGW